MKNRLLPFLSGTVHVNPLLPVVVTVLAGLLSLGLVFLFTGCTSASDAADSDLHLAETAVAAGSTDQAQDICDKLLHGSFGQQMSEAQLGKIAILYMKLAEASPDGSEDNTATATECFRRAMSLSGDSLSGFFGELPLDDQRHFVLLRRISMSIDHPVDLDDEDIASDEEAQSEALDEDFANDSDEGF